MRRARGRSVTGGAVLALLVLASGCARGPGATPARDCPGAVASVERWPAADRLFDSDARWAGGDGASSVALGGERVLWLFGDTLLWNADRSRRSGAELSNSVAIQLGLDPTRARMEFTWRERDGRPAPFFESRGRHFYWPGDGELVEGTLLVFLMGALRTPSTEFGVRVDHWAAVAIRNPEEPPERWPVEWLEAPPNDWGILVGSAAVLAHGPYLYAFSSTFEGPKGAFVARWPLAEVRALDLSRPRWWTERGWVAQTGRGAPPSPVFGSAQVEFSVHYDGLLGRWLAVQSVGLGVESPATLGLRRAAGLAGPWSPAREVFSPPEAKRSEAWVYAGKAHPELAAQGLALTYVANAREVERLARDASLYYPRFARLRWQCQGSG